MKREFLGEALGTAILLYVIVGSGIAAERLALDPALALFAHAMAVGMGLGVLIVVFGPVSGAHFNPVVTLALWRSRVIGSRAVGGYLGSQLAGALVGVVAANLSFEASLVAVSANPRFTLGVGVSELIVTFVLVLAILVLIRIEKTSLVAPTVAAWIAAAVFGTSSAAFANPAVTIVRVFSDTYTGIAPGSVFGFVLAQVIGAALAVAAASTLAPIPSDKERT
jgi:glycerol uptake facilitator-like aquaporin